MQKVTLDWSTYLAQMEQILGLELDETRRAELQLQFSRIGRHGRTADGLPPRRTPGNRRSV
ncbi:Uncharacterised protein [Raoultella terrigena]|uniref:Uncharacterized protein n=1 Tax=Raoultella terrigena TaxID=577 RepID=A0A4U9DHC0_RAOTE|nr:Uncharacterised protein [Raoultella terrigena]